MEPRNQERKPTGWDAQTMSMMLHDEAGRRDQVVVPPATSVVGNVRFWLLSERVRVCFAEGHKSTPNQSSPTRYLGSCDVGVKGGPLSYSEGPLAPKPTTVMRPHRPLGQVPTPLG